MLAELFISLYLLERKHFAHRFIKMYFHVNILFYCILCDNFKQVTIFLVVNDLMS